MNQLKLASRISFLLALLALAAPGCGDDDTTPVTDAGPGEDGGPPPTDAGDTTAPTVVATSPSDGAALVSTDTSISIAFSEPMDVTAGSLGAATDEGSIELGDASWSDDRTRVTFEPVEPLPAGATITVTVGTTFEDASGNSLAASYTFDFTTSDDVPPTIVRTTPSEGATDVDPATSSIEVELSEPMRVASGSARIEGPGTPALGAIAWTDRVARWTVSGLEAESSYRLVLEGFVDSAGNALDASALGANGALDFTTGADVVAPTVAESTPREGQLDVDVGLISRIALTFSEPMDESAGTFALEVGGESLALTPAWDRGGRRAVLDVAGLLASAAPHRVVLTGLEDRAGNALDGAAYLVDGALDFTTGADLFVPFVAFTSPEEGATAASPTLDVVVVFSEAMDPSTTSAPLTGDGRTVTVTGAWSSGNTVLTLSAPTLQAGRTYALDLTGFRDAGGTSVDATHAYLGDGIADFTLTAPTGETCGDALTEAEATSAAAGRVEWVVAPGAVTRSDGSAPCDPDGHGPDVLVRYRKTTPAARDGGTALRVSAVRTGTGTTTYLDVDVLAGDCRAGLPVADASRLRCLVERTTWDQWLDVGPGDYFVWVARDGASTFSGATIVVEEVPAIREGESCEAPLTTSSPDAIYTAPGDVGDPHRWVLPAGFPDALDRGRTHADPVAALSCFPEGSSVGHDAVITFDKASATSLMTVRVTMPTVSGRHGGVELVRGCDPADATRSEIACLPYSASPIDRELTFGGPAGPISAWLVERRSQPLPTGGWGDSPTATIEVTEFEPQAGDTCANAIPITAGATNVVTANRPWRANVPACLATGGVTWFRYTPTQGLGVLRTNGSTTGAVVDRASGQVIRCGGDDTGAGGEGLPIFGVPGEEICIALSSTSTVTQLTLEEIPYSGVRGIETGFDVEVPTGVNSPNTLAWMAALSDRVFRSGTGRIQSFPATGGPLGQQAVTGLTSDGGGAVARPDGLYVLSTTRSTTGPRVFRVTDATGAFLETPVPLENLPEDFRYPDREFDALTWDGTQFLAASTHLTTTQQFPETNGCCDPSIFYAIPADGSTPVEIGRNAMIVDVNGIAADATYLYVYGRVAGGYFPERPAAERSVWIEEIYRLRRDQLADPAQVPVVLFSGREMSNDQGGIFVDDTTAATALYFRTYGSPRSDVFVVVGPGGDAPRWVGTLWRTSGGNNDAGLGADPTGSTLWLLDSNPNPDRWIRLD